MQHAAQGLSTGRLPTGLVLPALCSLRAALQRDRPLGWPLAGLGSSGRLFGSHPPGGVPYLFPGRVPGVVWAEAQEGLHLLGEHRGGKLDRKALPWAC